MKIHKTFNLVMALLFAFSLVGIPATASAQEPALNPHIIFFYNDGVGPGGWVFGEEWPLGAQVTINIDIPNTPQSPDFTTQTTVKNTRPGQPGGRFVYSDDNHDISPGSIITVSDTITTRSLQVSGIHSIDMDDQNDQITGITSPNRGMQIFANAAVIQTQSDDQGNWSGDFTGITDLEYYTIVDIKVFDNDGDMTQRRWPIPNPIINASPNQGFVYAREWPSGTLVHMSVARSGSTIYTSDATVGPCGDGNPGGGPCGPNDAYFDLGYFDSGVTRFDLLPGDVITLTGGGITRSMIVSVLQVTEINASTDTFTGIADVGRDVGVGVCNNGPYLMVTPDSSGHWTANFAPFDIAPGECGGAEQYDENGNFTQQGWQAPDAPFIVVYPVADEVVGANWPAETMMTLTIDDPATQISTDYTAERIAHPSGIEDKDTVVAFRLTGLFDIHPGHIITLSGGATSKSVTVTGIHVTSVNPNTETISGTAAPGSDLNLNVCGPLGIAGCISRHEVANGTGQWSEDVSMPGDEDFEQDTLHLQPGSSGTTTQFDEDGDSTRIRLAVVTPLPPGFVPTETVVVPVGGSIQLATLVDLGTNSDLLGFDLVNAAQLAIEDFGPINGFSIIQTPFNSDCNEEFVPAEAAALSVIANPDYVGVIGHACSGSYEAGLPLYEGAGIVTVSGSSTRFGTPNFGQSVSNRVTLNDYYYENSNHWLPIVQAMPSVQAWNVRYQDRFGNEPADYAVLNYDATILLLKRIAQISQLRPDGSLLINRAELASAVRSTDNYEGVTGCFSFDGGGDRLPEEGNCNQPPIADAGGPYTVAWGAQLILDGSGSTDPDNNIASYEWDLDNDGQYDDATGVTVITSFHQIGDHIIGLRVTDDGGLGGTDTATVTVSPWMLKGFYQPVDMNGVYNIVKNGSTVPFKFEIFAGPTELTDIGYIKSFTSAQTSCNATATTDDIETTSTGGTSLRYDAIAGQFVYNLKMPRTAGKCYRVTMTTIDGSSLVAYFKLK
jgi:ABC-type branched-subunit amino acid transport system substrate-binding protein